MRTFQEFQNEFCRAHTCDKCKEKIICISVNAFGHTRCAYCNQVVKYPKPSKEEMVKWIQEKGDSWFTDKLVKQIMESKI